MSSLSVNEVMALIDRATARGLRTIKLPGFEATWELPTSRPAAAAQTRNVPAPRNQPVKNNYRPRTEAPRPSRPAERSNHPADYVVEFGKHRGRRIGDIPSRDLSEYYDYLLQGVHWNDLKPWVQKFVLKVEDFWNAY